jgi:flagellar FliL protein
VAEAAAAPADAPPGKKGLLGRILLPLLLLLAGLGGGFAFASFGPPLVPKGGEQKPPEPKVAPLEYVEIDNSFTANLKDTGRFIQVRIAVSTHGGAPVVEAVGRHKVAIVSVVLGVLAETGEAELAAPGGRDQLTRRMRLAINDVLQRKSGIAGVDDVFLVSFVLQ